MSGSSVVQYCPRCNRTFQFGEGIAACPSDGTALKKRSPLHNQVIAGKYTIIDELGAGGWGVVYLAKHQELGSKVAVKMLSTDLSQNSPRHVERFKQESRTLARLQHPAIVSVIDCGLSPWPFIVMEYVQGKLLSDILSEKGRLSENLIYLLAKRLAETLNYAHKMSVVHRDLKPKNIIITNIDPDHFDLKLLDFGVAKLLDAEERPEEGAEATGSPPYMSPEQFEVDAEVGPKSDVYALGCVLFECLAGHSPFNARTYIEWSSVHKHVRADLADGERVLSKSGKEMLKLILSCLSKDPESRPSADQLFQSLLEIKPSPGDPVDAVEHSLDIVKRKTRILAMPLCAALIVMFGVISVFSFVKGERKAKAHNKIALVDAVKTDLITSLASGKMAQAVENRPVSVKTESGEQIDFQLYSAKSARNLAIIIEAPKSGEVRALGALYNSLAERGIVVVQTVLTRQNESARLIDIVRACLKEVLADKVFSAGAPAKFALMVSNLKMEDGLACCAEFSASKETEHTPTISALVMCDATVSADEAPFDIKTLHALSTPVFNVLDADLEDKSRSTLGKRCNTVFSFGSGRQMYFNSRRVSLQKLPTYEDQMVLESLLESFIDVSLNHDKARESLLYSPKSATAVSSVGDLRFR